MEIAASGHMRNRIDVNHGACCWGRKLRARIEEGGKDSGCNSDSMVDSFIHRSWNDRGCFAALSRDG